LTANPCENGLTEPPLAAFFISARKPLCGRDFCREAIRPAFLRSRGLLSDIIPNPRFSRLSRAALVGNSLTLRFPATRWLTAAESLGSKFCGRIRTSTADHSSRPNRLTADPQQTRGWMPGPEHGSGRHRLHNPITTMPRLPKPDQMTPEERAEEIAEILARALLRIRFPDPDPVQDRGSKPNQQEMEPCEQN